MHLLPFDYAVRNLGRSPQRLSAILLGNALVVLLIVAAAAFVEGMRASLSIRHNSRNAIILATGSEESIERSEISATTPGILAASLPGIRQGAGVPFVSPEVLSALIMFADESSTEELRAVVRGITPAAYLVHERVEIVDGRSPRPGHHEILAGSLATEKLGLAAGSLAIGRSLWLEGEPWTVVGTFMARGTVMDAELWVPLSDLQVATKRDGLSCVVVQLGDGEFADVDAFTKMRIDLELTAIREADYYASLLHFYRPIQLMVWVTAILIALAGILGGLNTLHSAFAARAREIGMLQSLGYPRRAIVLSLIQESLIAAGASVVVAVVLAKLLLEGVSISFSMGIFQLVLNNTVLIAGASAGLFLGIVGALPPAWRCLNLPIPEALKSL